MSVPGNPLLTQSVAWSKQMLAASEQRVEDLQLRAVNAGVSYPPPAGDAEIHALARRRLAGLHLVVRHRR